MNGKSVKEIKATLRTLTRDRDMVDRCAAYFNRVITNLDEEGTLVLSPADVTMLFNCMCKEGRSAVLACAIWLTRG